MCTWIQEVIDSSTCGVLQTKEELYLNRKDPLTSQVPFLWDTHHSHVLIAVPQKKSKYDLFCNKTQYLFL